MGWSCSQLANKVLDVWKDACYKNTGSSNTWKDKKGNTYFYEVSSKEHDDGAITGAIWKIFDTDNHCKKTGTFRINRVGIIERSPKFLKDAVASEIATRLLHAHRNNKMM